MKRSIQCPAVVVLLAVLVFPTASLSQEQDDGESVRSTRLGLTVPPQIRREKRRAAKRGAWAFTLAAAAGAGYDSNIHLSPSAREDSAVFEGAIRAEALHYFTKKDRLRIRAEANAVPFVATSDPNEYNQKVSIFYGHRIDRDLKISITGEAKHSNDSVTNIRGNTLTRDFESWSYNLQPTIACELDNAHRFRLQYPAKRKDYVETSGKNSLDWWSHGPKLSYDWDVSDDLGFGLSYGFKVQNYDEEPASRANGIELVSNPDEEHFFHRVGADLAWEAQPWLELTAKAEWKRKDDRFKDFESYDNYTAGLGAKLTVAGFLISADVDYQHRGYDHRRDDTTGKLAFDRVDFSLATRTQLTRTVGLFGGYSLRWRDTNRSLGNSYRDHTAHTVIAGVSWAI